MRILTLPALGAIALLSACVTPKVHNELQASHDALVQSNEQLKIQSDRALTAAREAEAATKRAQEMLDRAVLDSTALGSEYRKLQRAYADLNANYEYALSNNSQLVQANLRENKAMLDRMESIAARLSAKEDSLKREQLRLAGLEEALQLRERRVNELESMIARQDSLASYFRKRIADALLGFEGRGLTVSMKDGRVYVSMDNRLLFPSGSWDVQAQGVSALTELGRVLAENRDLTLTVEGHTDADAYNGRGQIEDNWDLSVKRATAVVKILINKGVAPSQVQAAGRGEHQPVADNDSLENKAKNRRTEIIITPDLGELAEILGK